MNNKLLIPICTYEKQHQKTTPKNMIRDIKIKPVLNGFICTVGCQTVVFDSRERLLNDLRVYLENPEMVEQKYQAEAINPRLSEPGSILTGGMAHTALEKLRAAAETPSQAAVRKLTEPVSQGDNQR